MTYYSKQKKETLFDSIYDEFQHSPHDLRYESDDGYVIGYHFHHQYCNQIISSRRLTELEPSTQLFIRGATGCGKSSLILDNLLPLVKDSGKKMLILVPRTALSTQYKNKLAQTEAPWLLENLTTVGLSRQTSFGCVDVMTYQYLSELLLNSLDNWDAHKYDVIVMDEAHYFAEDAGFSSTTLYLLNAIISRTARRSVRIYLSATPEKVLDTIINLEFQYSGKFYMRMNSFGYHKYNCHFNIYDIADDYSYLQPFFFVKDDDIIDMIHANCDTQKYLICVDRRERGKYLAHQLGDNIAEYIDSDLKNGEKAETVNSIIINERFQKQVLIATSFLDVGVNIIDEEVTNVVVYSTEHAHFIQAIGRKRHVGTAKINLYIHVPSAKELNTLRGQYIKNINDSNEFKKKYIDNAEPPILSNIDHPFYILYKPSMRIFYNGLSMHFWAERIKELTDMINEMSCSSNPQESLAKHFLAWLGLDENYDTCYWLGSSNPNEVDEKIMTFLKKWLNIPMDKKKWQEFRQEFLAVHNQCSAPKEKWRERSNTLVGPQTINKFFDDPRIPYHVKQLSQTPLTYIVERR